MTCVSVNNTLTKCESLLSKFQRFYSKLFCLCNNIIFVAFCIEKQKIVIQFVMPTFAAETCSTQNTRTFQQLYILRTRPSPMEIKGNVRI